MMSKELRILVADDDPQMQVAIHASLARKGFEVEVVPHGKAGVEALAYCCKLGVEGIPPIVTRGVLIDIAGYLGVKHMKEGQVIRVEDIKGALKRQKITIEKGDVVLLRRRCGRKSNGGSVSRTARLRTC